MHTHKSRWQRFFLCRSNQSMAQMLEHALDWLYRKTEIHLRRHMNLLIIALSLFFHLGMHSIFIYFRVISKSPALKCVRLVASDKRLDKRTFIHWIDIFSEIWSNFIASIWLSIWLYAFSKLYECFNIVFSNASKANRFELNRCAVWPKSKQLNEIKRIIHSAINLIDHNLQ